MIKILYCPICNTWTPHVETNSGKEYVCNCGSVAKYVTQLIQVTERKYDDERLRRNFEGDVS